MEFLFSFLLLLVNLVDYETNINRYLFLAVSFVLIAALFYVCYKKQKCFLSTCLTLMCHTWPISWRNIFGDASETLQVTWFYLLGALVVLNALAKVRKLKDKPVNAVILGAFSALVIISVYPLLVSPSFSEGVKEFIIIGFFIILTFAAFLQSSSLDEENRQSIISAYIWVCVMTCVMLIYQREYYEIFGVALFNFSRGIYMGNDMTSASLLMGDTSCATIMLGSAVFYMLERFNNKNKRVLYGICIAITVIGLALTTRRTSVISLAVCFFIYVPYRYKSAKKRFNMFVVLTAVVILMMSYLLISRPVDDYTQYLDFNGRLENYIASVALFLEHPLGVGYDNVHLVSLLQDIVTHNTILRWLNMGGIIFTTLIVSLLVYFAICAYKKKLRDDFFVLIYCLFAMNFIPDILNGRFFVIPCMLCLISMPGVKKQMTEPKNETEPDKKRRVRNEKGAVLPTCFKR